MGRPSKYSPEILRQAPILAEKGFTDEEMAQVWGVNVDSVYEWKKVHPEFSEALKGGKEQADSRVERSLFERATGYSHPDTHISNYQGDVTVTPIVKHYAPDTVAAIFWLKNRRPAEWREKVEHDHKGGIQLEITKNW
jgi:hypothetical protein